MTKDKYSFILDLINNKKLSSPQKERILVLSLLEAKKEENKKNLEILRRIEEIEITLKRENNSNENNKEEFGKFVKRHSPKETYELLSFFSSTDGGMKNLTHSFNYGFITYNELMSKCREEYEIGKKKYPNVPESLLKRIEEFSFSDSPKWYVMRGDNKIEKKVGWSEPTFVKWYKERQTHPANDSYYNSEMIVPFKETIQARSDLGNLKKIIDEISYLVFQNSIKVITNDTIYTAQFYTDIDRLGLALFHIFTAIKHVSSKNFCDEVEINFKIQDTFKILEIIHLDSTPTKSVNDFDFIGGDLGTAKSNLWSLCNYDILANFKEGTFRKVILSDKLGETEKNKVTGKWIGKNFPISGENVKGFTHVLKFY
jgi:hypothetical protein